MVLLTQLRGWWEYTLLPRVPRALFGDENEELQKTFVKLQAVMAVLQGLQGIQNVLQKESAARQLINIGLQRVAHSSNKPAKLLPKAET